VRSPEAAAEALDGPSPAGLLTKARYLAKIQQHLRTPVCVWWQSAAGRVFLANVSSPQTTTHQALMPLAPNGTARVATDRPPRC
jgi:hypothetical protein